MGLNKLIISNNVTQKLSVYQQNCRFLIFEWYPPLTRFYRSKRLQPRSGSMYTYFGLESASGLHFDPLLTNSASHLFDFSVAYCILLFVVKADRFLQNMLILWVKLFFFLIVCHEKCFS